MVPGEERRGHGEEVKDLETAISQLGALFHVLQSWLEAA